MTRDESTETLLLVSGAAYSADVKMSPVMLLGSYLTAGEKALTSLSGSFLILIWAPKNRRLLFVTDRLATKKLYIYRNSQVLLFSTELKALLCHSNVPRDIDALAVGQFLISSHLIDNRSLIKNVTTLLPASVNEVNPKCYDSRTYWVPRVQASSDGELDEWADRLAHYIGAAVRRRCGTEPLLLPLSGGLDSRAIASFLPKDQLQKVVACSFGHSHCYDVRCGRAVARAKGVAFTYLPLPLDFFRQYIADGIRLTDGEVSIEALPMLRLLSAGEPGTKIVTGFLGDVLSGGHLLSFESYESDQAKLDHIWQRLYQRQGFSEVLLQRVLVPSRFREISGSAYQLMLDALRAADASTWEDRAMLVELHHRQSRYISYLGRVLASRYRNEEPFLDGDVLDSFLEMPLEFRRHQRAYRRMLVRHATELSAIREAKTRRSVATIDRFGSRLNRQASPNIEQRREWIPEGVEWRLKAMKRIAGQLVATLSRGWAGSHKRDAYVHHDESIRRIDTRWFRDRLNQDELLDDWFVKSELNAMFDEHLERKIDHSVRINNVVSFLEWRRMMGV
jgi:asparagine synthetase B (glutamine-hydrolysing)